MRKTAWIALVASASMIALAAPAAATARTKTVSAGPPHTGAAKHQLGAAFLKKYSPDVNDFFLHTVTINTGDTIKFMINGFHTVDLPGSSGQDLPFLIPGATVTGANDAAGNPFWFNGHVPSLSFNPKLLGPSGGSSYNGSTRVDSGVFMGNGNPPPFKVMFTKPGTYKYFCDIHPGMVGYVVVRPHGKSVPSAGQDAAALNKQLNSDLKAVKKLASTKVPKNEVSVGASASGGEELYAMFPSTLKVSAGTTVKFFMSRDSREAHTASFGPAGYLNTLSNAIGSPAPAAQVALYPSDPGTISFSPTTHGNGFANTGALDQDPTTPLPASDKIKFTQPGTYHFICLIHPFMQGTIVVH